MNFLIGLIPVPRYGIGLIYIFVKPSDTYIGPLVRWSVQLTNSPIGLMGLYIAAEGCSSPQELEREAEFLVVYNKG